MDNKFITVEQLEQSLLREEADDNKDLATLSQEMDEKIDVVDEEQDQHIANKNNPHGVTKEQVGLGNVENKSSETIRSEITKKNVVDALGYTPPETDTEYTHPTTAGNKHIPAGGTTNQILVWDDDGTAKWGNAIRGNWSQNDETADDYIEGRTHWVEDPVQVTILPETTVETTEDNPVYEWEPTGSTYVIGSEYTVSIDGVEYTTTAYDIMGFPCIGNPALAEVGEDTGEPFFSMEQEGVMILVTTAIGTHTLAIWGKQLTYHPLDYNYLPPIIGRAGEGKFAEVFNNTLENTASGYCSHAEGNQTTASGNHGHAEGNGTTASGDSSHAEGDATTASGGGSHAEGQSTTASGDYSHSEGYRTTASGDYQHVQGKFNIDDVDGKYAHIVGMGTNGNLKNAHTLDWNGVGWFAGGLKVGGTGQDDENAKEIATKDDVNTNTNTHNSSESAHSDIRKLITDHTEDNSNPHSVTKAQIGLTNVENIKQYSASNPPPYPVTKVNSKTGAVTLGASDVGADPAGTASSAVSTHNVSETAHEDIRESIGTVADNLSAHTSSTSNPHGVTKSQVGLANVDNVKQYSASNPPPYPVTKVNNKTGTITLGASDVGADPAGTASSAVSTHNTSTTAHSDIRELITGLTNRLNALADSDDTTLDQMSEIVEYIKSNKSLIDSITTSKVNVTDIVNNLTTNSTNKPLSAAQGVAIKALIDALQTEVNSKAAASSLTSHTGNTSNPHGVTKAQVGLGNVPNVATNDQTPTYTVATSAAALTSGEKLSVAFGKIAKAISDFIAHVANTSNPHSVTKSQVGLSNVPNVTTNNQTPTYTEATSLTKLTSGEVLSTAFGKISKAITDLIAHIGNSSNPHGVTKAQVGLGSVENKSSATIRGELTKANVTTALGYTPPETDTKYTHPSYTAKSAGLYKVTVDAIGHVSAATAVAKSDITGLGIPAQDTTYNNMTAATSSAAGKAGLVPAPGAGKNTSFLRGDGTWVVPTDTKYTHPTYTAKSAGFYKVTVDATGHVSAATAVAKADITALGIPAQDTVYTHPGYTARTGVPTANQTPAFGGTFSVTQPVSDATGHITAMTSRTITIPKTEATTSAAGLMSASDKTKLNSLTVPTVGVVTLTAAGWEEDTTLGLYKQTVTISGLTAKHKVDLDADYATVSLLSASLMPYNDNGSFYVVTETPPEVDVAVQYTLILTA